MTNNDPIVSLKTLGLVAIKQGLDAVTELERSRILEPWHLEMWQHLVSEFYLWQTQLVKSCDEKNMSSAAWSVRNLLELTVWLHYCVRSRDDAKRFYDDKGRDVFDFLNHTEILVKLYGPPDLENLMNLLNDARNRIAAKAEIDGYEDMDETYQRVRNVAQEIGLGPFFNSINKLLSKFAHPTAMMVFSYPDETSRAEACTVFLVIGTSLCTGCMQEVERYAKGVCARNE